MFGFLLPVPLIGGVGARAALVVLVLYGLLPIVRSTIVGITGIDRVDSDGRRRDGHDIARAPPPDRAAAGAALDRRGHPRRRRRRRRLGDHRGGDRRRRPRPVHLSRVVDGGLDGHSCRCDPGRAPGARCRRQPVVARAPAVARRRAAIAAEQRSAAAASLAIARARSAAPRWPSRSPRRDRRRLEELHRAADPRRDRRADHRARDRTAGAAPAESRRHTHLRSRAPGRGHRRLRRVHRHGADRDLPPTRATGSRRR